MKRLCAISFVIGAFLVGVGVSSPAAAAFVEVVKGPVSVSHGEGFRPVKGTAEVGPGWSVMAGPGGQGKIVYSSGCVVQVNPGSVVTVDANGQCNRAAAAKPYYLGHAARVDCDPDSKLGCPEPERRFPWLWAGALVGGGLLIACIADWCDDDGNGGRHRD
jgi:hypothetical protein